MFWKIENACFAMDTGREVATHMFFTFFAMAIRSTADTAKFYNRASSDGVDFPEFPAQISSTGIEVGHNRSSLYDVLSHISDYTTKMLGLSSGNCAFFRFSGVGIRQEWVEI